MTTMEMAIATLMAQSTEQETVVRPKKIWPWPVLAAATLHGAAFAVILAASFAPRQAPMLAGEVIPITLYAAPPVSIVANKPTAVATPQAKPVAEVKTAKPQPAPAQKIVNHPVKPLSIAPTPRPVAQSEKQSHQSRKQSPAVAEAPQTTQHEASADAASPVSATSVANEGAEGGAANAVIPARPRYRDNPPPSYPELARRRQMEGTVVVEALVNGRGRVDDLNVHASSGFNLLDDAALRAVRNWLFEPGKKGGMPMAMTVLVPVRFALR
ncbi:MAG: energy transducer TonB [Desulfobulbus sp.]|nr:energy transducer TonB [Desulfobulbus sp.]